MNHSNSRPRFGLIHLLAGLLVLLAASGCHTANGFGKDVERAGEKIQEGTK
jgi:predicted small secreted protein